MRNRIITLLMGILTFGLVNAQTVIFDPATYDGDLLDGMEVVEIDGTSYLQVVVDGWNSTIDIPEVSNILGTQINGMVKYSQGSSTVAEGITLADISSVVQIMDTVNLVPASWDASVMVPANTSLSQNPTLEGWHFRKAGITPEMELVHQIQFFGQKTTDWSPAAGDTMWVSRLVSVDASIMFDPATVDASALPDGMEIVEEGGEKLLKVELDGWNTNLPIAPFEVGENNKFTFKTKYEEGTSGVTNANAQIFVQPMNGAAAQFVATENPAPSELTEISADAKMETTVDAIQLAVQETSGNWDAVVGGILYISKITVSYEKAQQAEAPITTMLAKSDGASDITIDGLYDDAYGEVENLISQVAVNETGGDIAETDSYGLWMATADMDNFYIYVEVNDDTPIDLGESTQPWMNDGIELFIDIQNRRYVGGARIAGEQHQFRINVGTEGPAMGDFGMDGFFGDNDTTNIEFAVISSSAGYVVEARIPWATWYRTNSNTNQEALDAIDLKEGMKVAFEVSILDSDAGVDQRESILNWSNNTGTDVAYLSNEYYGEIELKGGWPTAIQRTAVETLNVYPNPAYDQVTIDMNDAENVEIYNVIGSLVEAKQLNGGRTINVSALNEGVYILKVTDANGNVAVAKFNKE